MYVLVLCLFFKLIILLSYPTVLANLDDDFSGLASPTSIQDQEAVINRHAVVNVKDRTSIINDDLSIVKVDMIANGNAYMNS